VKSGRTHAKLVAEAARQVLDSQAVDTPRGRGRPAGERHLDDFADLPPPPEHPLELVHWGQRLLALDLWRSLQGRANRELSQQIRSTVNSIARAMPLDALNEARRLIESDGDRLREASGGPQEEVMDGSAERDRSVHCSAPRG
jgi:hypothetical protein